MSLSEYLVKEGNPTFLVFEISESREKTFMRKKKRNGQKEHKMKENRNKCWNSIQLYTLYKEVGGQLQCRKSVFKKIAKHLGEEVIQLMSPGKANALVFEVEAVVSDRNK